MKVLFATAEVAPFAKVGGLADVAAALPHSLKAMGHDVRIVTPCHGSSRQAFRSSVDHRPLVVAVRGGQRTVDVATVEGEGGVPVLLVGDDEYFGRQAVYGEPDDLLRYDFFCRAVAALMATWDWVPDIIHLNDWHTAPLAFALRNLAWGNPALRGVASVFTIHNLRYRGPDEYHDYLCEAIYYSDMVTTVSPAYAREILTPEFGEGLHDLLRLREPHLVGILNGLGYDAYNPRTDRHITFRYDLGSLEDRAGNRLNLRRELGLPAASGPLAAMVARLTEQKGVDLVLQALPEVLAAGGQLVVLGEGDPRLEADLARAQQEHPEAVRFANRFDEGLARRLYAGADLLLMPSRYEPCGLGQLIAMRYGCIPIGRRTGGLADTILDPEAHPDHPTGFLFDEFSRFAFAGAFDRAVRAFRQPQAWSRLQESAMSRDFSWSASAVRYVETYTTALRSRGVSPAT